MHLKTKLTIAGYSNIYKGIREASIKKGVIELVFTNDGKIITQASLSADKVSFYKTLVKTQEKISLLCNRHSINEQELDYDKNKLSKAQEIFYKLSFLRKILFQVFVPIQWVITYRLKNERKWHKLIPHSSVFQADTFVIYKDEKYYIFYEELKFKDYHGYLIVGELDIKNNVLINKKVILEQDYHLSYPNVFEENGIYYMIPESAQAGSIDLYECTSFPYSWQKKQTLIDNICAVDTTPLKTNDAWYLFTSEKLKGAGGNEELTIYKSTHLFNKPFKKLYKNPVVTDVTNARMGGHFIKKDGEIFRVSQNCGKRYGHQVNINKILQLEGGYKEELVKTLKPSFGVLGFHTYNQDHELIVGDMEIARFDWYSLKRFFWERIMKKIFCK
ncbi:MAG TPA: hypothetical protein EYH20_02950 [Leucothrix sp.]|nr:hypothetical protein [Leucothrix sp.]